MEHSAVVPQLVALTQKNQLKGGVGLSRPHCQKNVLALVLGQFNNKKLIKCGVCLNVLITCKSH
jgi:hypothetical protein